MHRLPGQQLSHSTNDRGQGRIVSVCGWAVRMMASDGAGVHAVNMPAEKLQKKWGGKTLTWCQSGLGEAFSAAFAFVPTQPFADIVGDCILGWIEEFGWQIYRLR